MSSLLISIALLASCGGGNEPPAQSGAQVALPSASPNKLPPAQLAGLPAASPVVLPGAGKPAAASERAVRRELPGAGAVTNIVLENTGDTDQLGAPLTFGQVFADGHLASGETLAGRTADGKTIPLQVDVKARHPGGSVRHAVISAMAPALAPGQKRSIDLVKTAAPPAAAPAATGPDALLENGFSASVTLSLGGRPYSASADALLRAGDYTTWLSGPIANEWHVAAPLADADGKPHPHLSARFAIRAVAGNARARVDVTLENNWAYEPAPQNFVYDALIKVGGSQAYKAAALTHYHHARWRKVFWWGAAPQLHVRHNSAYLIASKAVPNYDQSVEVGETALAAMKKTFSGARSEPMGSGMAVPYMPGTGGRPDIGLLPGWAASYLLSMDQRAKEATLGTADLAGSWPAHYRDRATGRPVSLFDYPYMTLLGNKNDTRNPATKKLEAFPPCAAPGACKTPMRPDSSHQPGFAYLPYLVTGDYYYLEELQFWAMWNTFSSNPGYRENIKGLVKPDQVRGQAWSLRTLAQAAYITPDSDPLKDQFKFFVDSNLAWYNSNYSFNRGANLLGALTHGYAVGNTGLAPWMDDFFTSAVGHASELGFAAAEPLLLWKVKFPILRMQGNGACWIRAAMYSIKMRDSKTAPFYTDIGQAFQASTPPTLQALTCGSDEMAAALGLKTGEMIGYSAVTTGFPSNMQPALAYAAQAGGQAGQKAWTLFTKRTVKPNYGSGPQFAIIPR